MFAYNIFKRNHSLQTQLCYRLFLAMDERKPTKNRELLLCFYFCILTIYLTAAVFFRVKVERLVWPTLSTTPLFCGITIRCAYAKCLSEIIQPEFRLNILQDADYYN